MVGVDLKMPFRRLRKLFSLSYKEILFRVREKVNELYEFGRYALKLGQIPITEFLKKECLDPKVADPELLYSSFWSGERDVFFPETYDKKSRRAFFQSVFPGEKWRDEAEKILKGKVPLLGINSSLEESCGWNKDPLSGALWPKTFYAHMNKKSAGSTCDIKYVWEMNRHQFLIVLAKAFWLSGEEKYAAKIVILLDDWIDENPYNEGVNWTSSLELAVRSLSWVWVLFLCRESESFTPVFFQKLLKSLYEHCRYISRHLSLYSSPYNHLVGEAAALHVVGALLASCFRQGHEWEKLGWSLLVNNIEKQFHSDGFTVEQASFYHHFTLGFYLQSVFFRKLNKKNIPPVVLDRLEKAVEFSMSLAMPDGTQPMMGDIDNARSLYFNTQHSWDFRGYIGLGALLFNRPDFKYQAGEFPEEVFWLTDEDSLYAYLQIKQKTPEKVFRVFEKSGYCISRDSWSSDSHYLCFDVGDIADGLYESAIPSAAHGHADALSFVLSAYGIPFLVDGGFFTYFGELEWHKYFREVEAHNALKIGQHKQVEYCGRLKWQRAKKVKLLSWVSNEDFDCMSGSINYSPKINHTRKIIYCKKLFWLCADIVKNDTTKSSLSSFLHFSPACQLKEIRKGQTYCVINGDSNLLIHCFGKVKSHLKKGGANASEGWVGNGYGFKEAAWVIRFDWLDENSKTCLPMVLIPYKGDMDRISFSNNENVVKEQQIIAEFTIDRLKFSAEINHEGTIKVHSDRYNVLF